MLIKLDTYTKSFFRILAGSVDGWGGRRTNANRVVENLNLEIDGPTSIYTFPNTATLSTRTTTTQRSTEEEPGPIANRERSISAPNVSQAIINADTVLPAELSHLRNQQRDIRSKYPTVMFPYVRNVA